MPRGLEIWRHHDVLSVITMTPAPLLLPRFLHPEGKTNVRPMSDTELIRSRIRYNRHPFFSPFFHPFFTPSSSYLQKVNPAMSHSFSLHYCCISLPVASVCSSLLRQPILLFLGYCSIAWCHGPSQGQSSLYRATPLLIFSPQLFAYQDKAIMTGVRWNADGRVWLKGIRKIKEREKETNVTSNIKLQ